MVQPPEEKRMAPRHSYTFPVTYTGKVGTPAMPPQEVLFQGKIVDLSSGGSAMGRGGRTFREIPAPGRTWIPPSPRPGRVPVAARAQWVGGEGRWPRPVVAL